MSVPFILSQAFLENAITDELTSIEDSATVCLSSSTVPFSDTTTVTAALAGEAAFPGYARQLWDLTPIALVGNDYAVTEGTLIFNPPSSGAAQSITGFFILYTDPGSATVMLGGDNFSPADTIQVNGPGLALILDLKDYDAANP